MRFYIIPKKMFKINGNDNGDDRKSKGGIPMKLWVLIAAFVVLLSAVCIVLCVVNFVPAKLQAEGAWEISLAASTKAQRTEFFAQLGYEIQEVQSQEITIPCTDGQFGSYNELQKSQGFDLSAYCGRKATMYTMEIIGTNQGGEELFGVIIVYRGKVVAGHITDNLYPACVKPLVSG